MSMPFDNRCPAYRAVSLIGDKWSLLILRDLIVDGPRKFQDFNHSKTGMAPNILSNRLKRMEAEGILIKQLYSEHPPRYEYILTEKGKALGPVLRAIRDWGDSFTKNVDR